jgi:hypothetical protein
VSENRRSSLRNEFWVIGTGQYKRLWNGQKKNKSSLEAKMFQGGGSEKYCQMMLTGKTKS